MRPIRITPGAAGEIPAYLPLLWRFILKLQETYPGKKPYKLVMKEEI